MVTLVKKTEKIIFDLSGFPTPLVFKNRISVPTKNIRSAYQNAKYLETWEGNKAPGKDVPDMLKAGTFQKNKMQYFWAVNDLKNAIIVDLINESYEQLILEVENPEECMDLINAAIENA